MSTSQTNGKKLLIFLSHASQDKPLVIELCERLRADGFDPWLDKERLLPGMNWDMEIEKALRASDVILLCFSALSVEKEGYIQREYKRAMRYQEEKPDGTIFVIPVRLDKCDLPYFIKDIQFVDYPDDYERLVVSLNLRSGKLASAPPVPVKKEPQSAASSGSGGPSFQSSNTTGGINFQGATIHNIGGDVFTGSKYVVGAGEPKKVNPIKDEFEKIQAQIDGMPDDSDVDKSYLKMFVKDIEREVTRQGDFNGKKLRNSIKMLEQNSTEIYSCVAALLRSPVMDVPLEIQNLLN